MNPTPSTDVLAILRDSLMDAARGTLPFVAVGVAAGLVLLVVTWGIRKAVQSMNHVGENTGYVETDGHLFFDGQDLGDPYEYGSEAYDRQASLDRMDEIDLGGDNWEPATQASILAELREDDSFDEYGDHV